MARLLFLVVAVYFSLKNFSVTKYYAVKRFKLDPD